MNAPQPSSLRRPVEAPVPRKFQRAAAVRVISRVFAEHETLDEALGAVIAEMAIPASERAWLQDIGAGTLRWKGRLDRIIDSVALKKKPSGWLRKILQVAIYQLIAQDRAQPGSVVSETVNEIKRKEGYAPSRFANAILRKIGTHAAEYRAMPFPAEASLEEQAFWASLPEWLWRKIVEQQGSDWAQAFAQACLLRPVIWIRSRSAQPWATIEGPAPGSYQITQGGPITSRSGFQEGEFFVQDISSQVLIHEMSTEVRRALGDGPLAVLDLCAAPGGKSAGLSWNGFQVTASDRARFELLEQTLKRVAPSVSIVQQTELHSLPPQDLVWVDAPCSGSGIIRRHPDVRWLRQEKELGKLREVQLQLVKKAWDGVKPGGFLAYSVCSVLKDEGPEILAQARSQVMLGGNLVREWLLSPQNAPYGDGFYGALVRK